MWSMGNLGLLFTFILVAIKSCVNPNLLVAQFWWVEQTGEWFAQFCSVLFLIRIAPRLSVDYWLTQLARYLSPSCLVCVAIGTFSLSFNYSIKWIHWSNALIGLYTRPLYRLASNVFRVPSIVLPAAFARQLTVWIDAFTTLFIIAVFLKTNEYTTHIILIWPLKKISNAMRRIQLKTSFWISCQIREHWPIVDCFQVNDTAITYWARRKSPPEQQPLFIIHLCPWRSGEFPYIRNVCLDFNFAIQTASKHIFNNFIEWITYGTSFIWHSVIQLGQMASLFDVLKQIQTNAGKL